MELELKNLKKKYGGKTALSDFNMTLTEGIYGFLGPNGSGKSTLMNIITGNIVPTDGKIFYNGQDVTGMASDFRAVLGYMPQQQALYPTFTVMRFLAYVAALRGMKNRQIKDAIPYVLSKVGLEAEAGKKIGELSGGMKQRLLIAQAIVNDPEIIILDEPTAGLDPKQRVAVRNLISEIALHKIVIIATHIVSDIEYIAKMIVLMDHGRKLHACSLSELLGKLEGRVFELKVREMELEEVYSRFRVGNMTGSVDGIRVRVLSKNAPEGFVYHSVHPSLEDVYLAFYEE